MKRNFLVFILVCVLHLVAGCSKDTEDPTPMPERSEEPEIVEKITETPEETIDEIPETNTDSLGIVEILNEALIDPNYILVNDAGNNRAFLMDKKANLLHEWNIGHHLGNDAYLLPNGTMLASLEADDPQIRFGGQGGKIQFIEKDGRVLWNFDYSSENAETHHDVELLPNGNVLAIVWEKKTTEEAITAGSLLEVPIFPEAIIEVDPTSNAIVWEWHSWNHLIQDYDDTKANFGVVSENPGLIDVNYIPSENGDIMHANGISYDAENDVIFLSVNFFSEIWVIDHSTTTAEASSNTGGNYDKGGDLIYRFGNPEAYDNPEGPRLFHHNHFPNFQADTEGNRMFVFSNGVEIGQSTAYELRLPETYDLKPNTNNEPKIIWTFTDPELHSPKVSGVVTLPNGNRLITEGDFGIWEVTLQGEAVWKFSGDGFYWRAYSYKKDSPEIKLLGL
jgi:hypothetical protein